MSEVLKLFEPMEMTFVIKDADMETLSNILNDIDVTVTPYFEIHDKHGHSAVYYRENPEIIRCKDCKFFSKNVRCVGGYYDGCSEWASEGNETPVNENDFCSRAERRTDE